MRTVVITVVALVSCFSQQVVSQTQEQDYSRSAVYAELGGQGIFYTLNFDYRFTRHLCGRIGFTRFTLEDFFGSDLTITGFPLMAEYLVGGGNHSLELGAGGILVQGTSTFRFISASSKWGLVGTTTVGYRYQPSDGGLFFRVSIPAFFTSGGSGIWGGLSIGDAF